MQEMYLTGFEYIFRNTLIYDEDIFETGKRISYIVKIFILIHTSSTWTRLK